MISPSRVLYAVVVVSGIILRTANAGGCMVYSDIYVKWETGRGV